MKTETFQDTGYSCNCSGPKATIEIKKLPNAIRLRVFCNDCGLAFFFEKPIQYDVPQLEQLEMFNENNS